MKLNKEVIGYFKEWQKATGKCVDLDLDLLDFKLASLESFTTFCKGKTPIYSDTGTSCKVIKSGMAKGKRNNFNLEKDYFLDLNRVNNPSYIEKGDLLLNTTGKGTAGRVTLFALENKYVTDSHITTIKVDKEKYSPEYLLNYFISFGFKNLENMAEGSGGQVELYQPKVKELEILLPENNEVSIELQKALVDFIDYYQSIFQNYRDSIHYFKTQTEVFNKAFLPAIFSGDAGEFIVKYFEQWIRNTGRSKELDWNSLTFNDKKLKDICGFPPRTRIKGRVDLSIQEYQQLNIAKKEKYYPLITGTVNNNQVAGYIHENRLSPDSLSEGKCISWTRINGKRFFLQHSPVATNDDSFIMEVRKENNINYVLYAILAKMSDSEFGWSDKAGKEKVKNIDILIPINAESIKIQQLIVEFIDEWVVWKDKLYKSADNLLVKLDELEKGLIAKVFEGKRDDA